MYYGLDVHKEFIQVCELSHDGKRLRDFRINCVPTEIRRFVRSLGKDSQVVLEATFHTWAIYELLSKQLGSSRVIVANPAQVKAIAHARIKTDKIDAHILAQLLRADFVPKVQMPDEETWQLRQLTHHRRYLTRQETTHKNVIRGVLNKKLMDCPYTDLSGESAKQWFLEHRSAFNLTEQIIIDNAYALLDQVMESISRVDEELTRFAEQTKQAKLLITIPGVSVATATGLLSAIGDVNRFETPEKLASYLGLVPSVSQSAGRCYQGGITKTGRSLARWLAVESAQKLARSDSPISATYHRVRKKKGHNVAVVALARKLTVLIWHMLKANEPYRYAPVSRTTKKLYQVSPEVKRATRGKAAKTLNDVYKKFDLPTLESAKPAEQKAAAKNRRVITASRAHAQNFTERSKRSHTR